MKTEFITIPIRYRIQHDGSKEDRARAIYWLRDIAFDGHHSVLSIAEPTNGQPEARKVVAAFAAMSPK